VVIGLSKYPALSPRRKLFKFFELLLAYPSRCFREHRQRVAANAAALRPRPSDEKFREEFSLTVLSGIDPKPCGFQTK